MFFLSSLFIMGISNEGKAQDRDNFMVKVDGLGCPFCAYGLEKKFKELKGIKNPKIEMETGKFTFTYPSEKNLSIERVQKQVEAAGYTPVSVKITRADGSIENSESTSANTALNTDSQIIKTKFVVKGNCGMCEARIEKAAKSIAGVTKADWDKTSKNIRVEFDEKQTSLADIKQKIAASGHDTDDIKAQTKVYENLPGCCLYR